MISFMAYHGYIPVVKRYLTNFINPTVLEVGLDRGVTTIPIITFMSRFHNKFRFVGIDILLQESLKITLSHLDLSSDQVVDIRTENSLTVLPSLAKENLKFDVVFLDGDHNYYTVAKELEHLNELTHDKSLVVIDDYYGKWSERDLWYSQRQEYHDVTAATVPQNTERHGVRPAVDEFVSSNPMWKMETLMQGEPVILMRR